MEKVFIIGGAGYKGTVLSDLLLKCGGYDVTVFDNLHRGPDGILHLIGHPNYRFVKADIRDEKAVADNIPLADIVIHLAAIVGYPECARDPAAAKTINDEGTRIVARHTHKRQKVIYASTGSTYGLLDGACTETSTTSPLTLYGETKLAGEKYMLDAGAVIYRFATIFGVSPRLRLDLLVNDFVWKASNERVLVLFESHHRRTFLAVQDSSRAYLHGIISDSIKGGEIYNVGNRNLNMTKSEIAHTIVKFAPCHIHEADIGEDPDKRDYVVDYSKIGKTGYYPAFGLEDGIKDLLKIVPYIKKDAYG